MKKLFLCGVILSFVLMGILFSFGIVNACSGDDCPSNKIGNVKDCGNGNAGYILIHSGEIEGQKNDIGIWVNPTTIPALKGDKGDTGAIGLQGIQGIKGDKGIKGDTGSQGVQGLKGDKGDTGLAGKDGLNGINGVDGQNGLDGLNGQKGDNGDKGDLGEKGNIGDNGEQGIQGFQGLQGIQGVIGKDGKDVDPKEVKRLDNKNIEQDNRLNNLDNGVNNLDNRVSKLEKTAYVLETSFVIIDNKNLTIKPFVRQNFTRGKVDVVGLKIDIKLCKSYEEKLIEKINTRLEKLEKTIGSSPVIEKVVDNKGNLISIKINSAGLQVGKEF